MSPGMPGTGIGGLFYILTALWMPVCEIGRWIRGRPTGRWPLVARQFAIAAGVVVITSSVFWALDSMFMLHQAVARQLAGKAHAAHSLRIPALITTTGVLVALIGAVHLARFFLWLRSARPTEQ